MSVNSTSARVEVRWLEELSPDEEYKIEYRLVDEPRTDAVIMYVQATQTQTVITGLGELCEV